jgi:excisionase family DNA binding protein
MKRTKALKRNQMITLPKGRQFVTTAEIARALGCTEKSVRELMAKGQLAGRRIGGRWRMHKKDFLRLIRPDQGSMERVA